MWRIPKYKERNISLLVKAGMHLLCGIAAAFCILLDPVSSQGAIGTTTQNWPATPLFAQAAYPATGISYNALAGNNRLLVVGISTSTTAVAQAQPTVTYGGISMTAATGYSTATIQQHSYLFYLPLGSSAVADTGKTIAVTISGGTVRYCIVNAAVYTDVDQTTPVGSPVASNNGTTASTILGPFTSVVNSGDMGISVLNAVSSGASKANAATITIGTTGHVWSQVSTAASGRIVGSMRTTFATTINVNSATATTQTSSTATLNSTAAITIKPLKGITLANGTTVAGNKAVYVNDGANSSNVVVDAFSMTADSTTNVTSITFTSNANTTSGNISGIKIWRKVGATLSAWEATDTQVGAIMPANGGAVTFSGLNEPVTTATSNYIVTYDVAPGATASTTNILTCTITAITPAAIALTDTTALSASVYIYPTTTIGNGVEPATKRLPKGSAPTNLDAFTLTHNGGTTNEDDTITKVTVTLSPPGISGDVSNFSKVGLLEVVSADGATVYGSLNAATTGDVWTITTSGLKAVAGNPVTYYIRATTAASIVPGYFNFTGTITDIIHGSNKLVNNDSGGQTLYIDTELPTGPTSLTAVTGTNAGEINLSNWDAAVDPNSGSLDAATPYIIVRGAEGGIDPAPFCVDGTDITSNPLVTIDYSGRSVVDKGLNSTTGPIYHYRVCAKDAQGNISSGATANAAPKLSAICNIKPTVLLGVEDPITHLPQDQIIKTDGGLPFNVTITNMDIGACPDVNFNIILTNESANAANFDKLFTTPVLVGKTAGPGGTNKTTAVVPIEIHPKIGASVSQLEKYIFAVKVTADGHPDETTPTATALLNDMPPIVHNSANMAKYQYGTWGQAFTCATCHSNSTTNIKGIFQVISTSIGRKNVVFTKTSSVATDSDGVYSNDQRTVKNISNNVCSVCHHRTRQHQYSASKADSNVTLGDGTVIGVVGPNGNEGYNTEHHNSRNCVNCHTHNTAFKSIYGLCGDCHGFKGTQYSPINAGTMVKDPPTGALGTNPPSYGAHLRHNIARISCAACHSNTNHGLDTTAWTGDKYLQIGFKIDKDTYPNFNLTSYIVGGVFKGTTSLNYPYVWSAGPGTTINKVENFNSTCSTYCHGNWSGNVGTNTVPNWVGTGQAACGGCHNATGANPPQSGSHAKHAGNTGAGLGIACIKCHGTYTNYTGSAHINGNVQWDLSALNAGAKYNNTPAGSTGAPATDNSSNYATCNTIYCHSNVQTGVDGTGAPDSWASPKWGDPSTAQCGSCHAYNPPVSGGHPQHENAEFAFDCHVCHNSGGTTSPLNHANGQVNMQFIGLGQNTVYSRGNSVTPQTAFGSCSNSDCHGRFNRTWGPATSLPLCEKCHGSRTSAGFYNTQGPNGTLSNYSVGVGVHDIHLQNLNSPRKATFARFTSLNAGYNCNQCHSVPKGQFSSGHMDDALPAEVKFTHISSIANTGQAKFSYYTSPAYSFATQTCSAVWCHGAGMNSNNSTGPYAGIPSSIQRQNPQWNVPYLTGNGASDCTKCHAIPPPAPDSNYIHYGKTMVNCKECHTHLTNDGFGFKDKSLHVNGVIDGGCDKCHGYPPINNIVGDHEGLATPAQGALTLGTAGAHNAHVLNINIGKNCQTCHYNFNSAMPSNNLELGFNAFGGAVTSGTFTGYSNTGTHPNWTATNPGTVIQKVTTGANVCSNLYCHGGGIWNGSSYTLNPLGGGSKTNPNWEGGSNDAICGTCHGTDTTNAPAGGSHSRHALSSNGGIGLLCSTCHGANINMTHVNGAVSWALDRTSPVIGANATYNNLSSGSITGLAPRNNGNDYRTCNNVYCHSDVQSSNGTGLPTSYSTPKWGDPATVVCGSCHKNMATDATATGSHVKHANTSTGMGVVCGYCHQDGGSGSVLHADGAIYINFTSYVGGAYSKGTAYNTGMNKAAGSSSYGNCSNTFCHGTVASPNWGTSGPLACNACHGATADKSASPSWSGRHTTHYNYSTLPTIYNDTLTDLSSTTKYRFNCKHCHDADSSKHSLRPYSSAAAARVFFGVSSAGTGARRGKYVYGKAISATDNGFKYTAGSCNTSYCHSNGQGGIPKQTFLNWTTRPTAGSNCLFCHDGKSPNATPSALSGKHDKHMNPLNNTGGNSILGTGNGFNCIDCHAVTITDTTNLTIANKGKHVNALVDYSGARANKNYNSSSKVCSNVYCHSNGNPNATIFVSMTTSKAWNGSGTITTCNKCHGRGAGNTLGYPDYANGGTGAGIATANLHPGHLNGMTDTTACADCHRRSIDTLVANKFRPYSTMHLSGGANVNFNTAKSYIGSKAAQTTNGMQVTCSNLNCHGQATPIWGGGKAGSGAAGVRTCTKCHGDAASSYANYSAPQIAPGYNATATDTSMVTTAPTSPRIGAHKNHLTAANAISAPVKCSECHVLLTGASDAAAMRSANHWNYSTATLTFTGRAVAGGYSPATAGRTNGALQCNNTWCHSGKYNSGIGAPFWNMTGFVKETGTTVGQCVKCHAMPPTGYAGHPATLSNLSSMSNIYNRCGSCHTNVSSSASTVGNVFVDKTKHVNGTIEYISNCNGCHAYDLTGGGTTWTPALSGGAGTGAHIKHIAFIKSRLNIVSLTATGQTFGIGEPAGVCGTCHSNTLADHNNGSRQITFGAGGTANTMGAGYGGSMSLILGGSNPSFNTTGKTCSNIICHYATTPNWY